MFTYNENRVLFLERGSLKFPCSVSVTIQLTPNPARGDKVAGLTVVVNSRARVNWNANTGRSIAQCDPPLPATKAGATVGGIGLIINGRAVEAKWECASRDELLGTLSALHFVLPLSLSLELSDAVTPAVTSGRVGDAEFGWQVAGTGVHGETAEAAERDARCLRALQRLPALCDQQNARLLAAAAYFQRAVRLLAVGLGPSEFAGEAVINLAESLEVLFPGAPLQTRDAVRAGLAQLGYDSALIEGTFVPCLVMRSTLDAAHVRMATLAADERRKLQLYMEAVVGEFRLLVVRVADAVIQGNIDLAPYTDERAPGEDLARILNNLSGNYT